MTKQTFASLEGPARGTEWRGQPKRTSKKIINLFRSLIIDALPFACCAQLIDRHIHTPYSKASDKLKACYHKRKRQHASRLHCHGIQAVVNIELNGAHITKPTERLF
eukprot:scaffold2220_cov22-Prasinocladus_malaysianus.AAC.1